MTERRNDGEYAQKQYNKNVKEYNIKLDNESVASMRLKETNLVNRLELLCDCKYSLNVVVTQLLNQVSNRRIVLKN